MTKEFYTVEEIAELLRIRPGTVRNRLSYRGNDLPPSVVIGRRRLFPLPVIRLGSSCVSCRIPSRALP